MNAITDREMLQYRGLRSRVFHRARLLIPILHPGILDRGGQLDSFDYIPGVAGIPDRVYLTLRDAEDCGPFALPANLFTEAEETALAQAEKLRTGTSLAA